MFTFGAYYDIHACNDYKVNTSVEQYNFPNLGTVRKTYNGIKYYICIDGHYTEYNPNNSIYCQIYAKLKKQYELLKKLSI